MGVDARGVAGARQGNVGRGGMWRGGRRRGGVWERGSGGLPGNVGVSTGGSGRLQEYSGAGREGGGGLKGCDARKRGVSHNATTS